MSTGSNNTTSAGAIAPPSTSSALPEVANGKKVVIKSADMDPDVQKEAFEKFNVEKDSHAWGSLCNH
ncbi:hypothetical protein Leryth_005820 [Lithospermum erythrorhizon]|nr:hypothetical protein Leryth_005820 [Lithospermum erythrorhizon]